VYEPGQHRPSDHTTALATGKDVLSYFLKNGHAASKQLFYCNQRKPSHFLDIVSTFDLEVVSREAREAHHFTMTAMGVTEVHGSGEAEFTVLGDWIRLSTAAALLSELHFFKFFR